MSRDIDPEEINRKFKKEQEEFWKNNPLASNPDSFLSPKEREEREKREEIEEKLTGKLINIY